jgi:hypothetical protein
MSTIPIALYGLEVPPGGVLIPAMQEDSFPDASVSHFGFSSAIALRWRLK